MHIWSEKKYYESFGNFDTLQFLKVVSGSNVLVESMAFKDKGHQRFLFSPTASLLHVKFNYYPLVDITFYTWIIIAYETYMEKILLKWKVLYHFSSVQLLSHVRLFATPWIKARQASLSITNSQSLLKLMSIELVMPSSPLYFKKTQPVHPKGDQSWVLNGRTDAEAKTPILWPPHAKSWLIGKDLYAGRDWGQEEKGTTEDEMAGWHHLPYNKQWNIKISTIKFNLSRS